MYVCITITLARRDRITFAGFHNSRLTHLHLRQITSLGPLQAIVISHPHYYTTLADWSRTFRCPVYTSADDSKWLEADLIRSTPGAESRLIESPTEAIVPGVTAVKTGGHFDGSLVLLWADVLLIADTLVTVPVSHLVFLFLTSLLLYPRAHFGVLFLFYYSSRHIHPPPMPPAPSVIPSCTPSPT